jgi:hypothetical protein
MSTFLVIAFISVRKWWVARHCVMFFVDSFNASNSSSSNHHLTSVTSDPPTFWSPCSGTAQLPLPLSHPLVSYGITGQLILNPQMMTLWHIAPGTFNCCFVPIRSYSELPALSFRSRHADTVVKFTTSSVWQQTSWKIWSWFGQFLHKTHCLSESRLRLTGLSDYWYIQVSCPCLPGDIPAHHEAQSSWQSE